MAVCCVCVMLNCCVGVTDPGATDRFATDQCWGPHGDPNAYNGGTFGGLRKKMDYIETLGFDAVWLSPVTQQGDDHLGMSAWKGRAAAGGSACCSQCK